MNHPDIRNRIPEAHPGEALFEPEIRSFLSPSARFCAERMLIFSTVESTNQLAKELARKGAEHGTVLLADRQTAGRGRLSRRFSSPPGGLYMSLILEPARLPFLRTDLVTPFTGIAVCEAVTEVTGKKPGIKWVNDLLLGGKKICGILAEAVAGPESNCVDRIVVGIGVNLHARPEDFPPEIRDIAASVDPDREIPGLRNRLAAAILNRMLGSGVSMDPKDILEQYKQHLMMLGKPVTVVQGEESFQAMAMDLDSDGHLIVKKKDGEILSLSSGEIRIRV